MPAADRSSGSTRPAMPPRAEIRVAEPGELAQCLAIRREVFVDEQRVPLHEEVDAHDAAAIHFVALVDGAAVGTARLRMLPDGTPKAERVAVRAPWRRRGVGEALMRALESAARGASEIVLNAQVPVIAFYERLGYRAEGPVFDEAGIPHRAMRKRLS
jgi:predicted GNAT family N-acyltransferase